MPQINSGKSPPWVSGEIVTAAGLNGMIDAATLDPSAITSQTNLTTLTGDEYALVVDTAGLLKKTQLKNSLLTGEDIKTDSITQVTGSSAILTIESNPSVAMLLRGTGGLSLQTETGGITMNTIASGGTGSIGVQSNGMTFDGQGSGATGVIDFQTRTIFSHTGAIKLPVGTTAQRPATPVAGDTRFNSTTSQTETYNGSSWSSGYVLYEVYEETLPAWVAIVAGNQAAVVTTASFTKPANEIWEFEIDGTWTLVRGYGAEYGFRYSTETFQTGSYLESDYDFSSGVTALSTRSIHHRWTVPAGTALSARTVVVDVSVGAGSQLRMFQNTPVYTAIITTGSLPVSKFRIYKYKTV